MSNRRDIDVERTGPWLSEAEVTELLSISKDELSERLGRREIIGCRFREGTFFPLWQARPGQMVRGISEVVEVLFDGGATMDTCALWLAAHDQNDTPMWHHLRMGRVADVLVAARRTARDWKTEKHGSENSSDA